MYAVITTGGKQYRVEVGNTFRVEKIPGEIGTFVNFDKVLMFSDGQTVQIGRPVVENVTVSGRIVEQARGPKIIVFKYKRRKRYRRKQGHRQAYTAIRIDRITYPGSDVEEKPSAAAESLASPEPVSIGSEETKPSAAAESEQLAAMDAATPETMSQSIESAAMISTQSDSSTESVEK